MERHQEQDSMKEQPPSSINSESPIINEKIEEKKVNQRPEIREEPKKYSHKKKKLHLSFEDEFEQQQGPTIKVTKNLTLNKQNNVAKDRRKSSHGENLEETLKAEYLQKIEKLKQELIELEYSYWDGADVVKKLRRKKKQKIKDLMEVCRLELTSNNKSLVNMSASDFLFVVKDFIVPPEMALYEIEALELKTKKNDLILNLRNVKIKKDGKDLTLSVNLDGPIRIIEKSRFQKSKAMFPFCNWQTLKITN